MKLSRSSLAARRVIHQQKGDIQRLRIELERRGDLNPLSNPRELGDFCVGKEDPTHQPLVFFGLGSQKKEHPQTPSILPKEVYMILYVYM